MIAIFCSDGDGYDSIIAIVSNEKYVSKFIKNHTGFKDVGYTENGREYWCKFFDKDREGILIMTEE